MKRRNDITAAPVPAERLEAELLRGRQVEAVRRTDALERRRAQAGHTRAVADVDEDARRADLDRVEREETASDNADLARMHRRARSAGERIRIKSDMARSGEVRALRLEQLRTLNLKVLVPVLLGFAAWSTTGVHHGAVRLMDVGHNAYGDPMWWALWILEPVLIGAVVWVTIVRARLAASGGQIADKAVQVATGCLAVSVALNLAAGAPAHRPDSWPAWCAMFAAMLAHVVGPAGAAGTAHLIGLVDDSIADADPWHDGDEPVPLLADMNLNLPTPATAVTVPVLTEAETDAEALDAEFATGDVEPEPRTENGPTGAEAWVTEQAQIAADQIAEFLARRDPPEDGVTSSPATPDPDDPQGAARSPSSAPETATMRPGHIDSEQRADTPGTEPASEGAARVASAIEARRALGEQTRARVAGYLAARPKATAEQIAAALGVSAKTAQRHRTAIQEETT